MKKIIFMAVISLLLTACLPIKKTDETKTVGKTEITRESTQTETESLEDLEKAANETEIENFDQEIQALDKDINQL